MAVSSRPAVFIDKDGTLIDDLPYNTDPARITLTDDAGTALQLLAARGYALVVVSNQQGIARGWLRDADLRIARERIAQLLDDYAVRLTGFYWCPHDAWSCRGRLAWACACRKPAPGMLLQAAADLALDLGSSWMVGDILDDVEAGRRAGCRTVLIDNGNETEWRCTVQRQPHRIAANLGIAARLIDTSSTPLPRDAAP